MKHILCLCFGVAFILLSCQENQTKNDENLKSVDSVSYFFEKAKITDSLPHKISFYNKGLKFIQQSSDTLLPLLLDHKIYYHNQLKEYDSSLFFADSLQRLAINQKDTSRTALALYRKAVINRFLDNQDEVFKNAFEARQYYLQLKDSTKAARRSLEMATAQSRLQDYTGSQESATEALHYLNKEKDAQYLSSAFNIIAIAYRNQGFYEDALKEYENSLRHAQNLKDSLTNQNNIGLVYQDKEEYGKAISVFEEIFRKNTQEDYISRARYLDNLAFAKWLQNRKLDVSSELLRALDWRKQHNDHSGLTASYYHLSRFYENQDKIKAIDYAEKWLKTATSNNSLQAQVAALKHLLALKPNETDYISEYIHLDDSLNALNLKAENTFAKIRFDEERKQQKISSLETSAAQQALENQEIKFRNYLLAFLILIILALAFFGNYYNRQKHKKEKIREIYNTETRISKVIHDELANDLYNIMSRLEAIVPENIIDKLEKIYLRTRDISRENRDVDTGNNYLKHLLATLSSICPENTRLIISGEKKIAWDDLDVEKKLVIHRVLQEIMVNMKKHSGASFLAFVFSEEEKYLKIEYSDNGVGCTNEALKNGNGLRNVENRIFSINGKLIFENEEGNGLKIMIHIPL